MDDQQVADAGRSRPLERVLVEPVLDGTVEFEPFEGLIQHRATGPVLTSTGGSWLPRLEEGDHVLAVPMDSDDADAPVLRVLGTADEHLAGSVRVEVVGDRSRRDQRDTERHDTSDAPVTVLADGVELGCRAVDVSLTGVLVSCSSSPLAPGTVVVVRADGIEVTGRVVRTDGSDAGVQFEPGQRLAVVRLLRLLTPAFTPVPSP